VRTGDHSSLRLLFRRKSRRNGEERVQPGPTPASSKRFLKQGHPFLSPLILHSHSRSPRTQVRPINILGTCWPGFTIAIGTRGCEPIIDGFRLTFGGAVAQIGGGESTLHIIGTGPSAAAKSTSVRPYIVGPRGKLRPLLRWLGGGCD
jgi:hypothetical protein